MGRMRTAAVVLLLHTAVLVVSHGEEDMDVSVVQASRSVNTTESSNPFAYLYDEPNYASLKVYSGWMMAHIGLMTLAWFFTLPVAVMLSIARSNLALPLQFVFLVINGLGVLASTIYNVNTPDLYENNKHHTIGWIATWIMTAQVAMGLLFTYAGRQKAVRVPSKSSEHAAFLPHTLESLNDRAILHKHSWSSDSGQGTEPPSPGRSREGSADQNVPFSKLEDAGEPDDTDDLIDLPCSSTAKASPWYEITRRGDFIFSHMPRWTTGKFVKFVNVAEAVYEAIDRLILVLGFIVLVTGWVTYAGIFRSNNIFNGLAHFVKGGIFFWYGLLTLGRWSGSFADLGWAWNCKPSDSSAGWKRRMPTAEFTESFVIWLYGCTNVFLEHLAAWGGAWTAQDFEHVSISIMFFGGGLAGMLVESPRIRRWLNTEVDHMSTSLDARLTELGERSSNSSTSLNIMPALTILLLGIMMSSHHQASAVSTKVHTMWGTLLVGFAVCRALTYMLNYVSPPKSIYPSRPPTELAASFCLIAGGLIFMISTRDVIHYIEKWNLMGMFVFTIVVGFTAFLMAYQILVTGIKGWAIRREQRRRRLTRH